MNNDNPMDVDNNNINNDNNHSNDNNNINNDNNDHINDDNNDNNNNDNDEKSLSFDEIEKEARLELDDYLIKQNVDPRLGDAFKLIIKIKDPKPKDQKRAFSVTYASPNGSMCQTKRDVSETILYQVDCGSVLTKNNAKIESYHSAMKDVNNIIKQGLPKRIENFRVINFGTIDKRPAFHNKFQIYPVGYRCEVTLNSLDSNATIYGDKYVLECEVRARLDDQPDFVITNTTTGAIYWAVGNEREAWKKFDPNNLYGDTALSFFNLKIELLIEGLEGAVDLESYTYHVERGYGVTYKTQEESMVLKASGAPRERNRVQRLQTAGLSKDELKQKEEQLREQQALDKEFTKTIAKADQERKAKEREELKKIKEQEIQLAKEKREEEKRLRDLEKLEQKRSRTSIDPSEKNRETSVTIDATSADFLQIIRDESSNLVVEKFDAEQDDKDELEFCSLVDSTKSLEAILQEAKSCSEYFGFSDLENESDVNIDWDALINVANTLAVYKNHLQHQLDVSLTTLINHLVSIASEKERPILEKFFDFLERDESKKEETDKVGDDSNVDMEIPKDNKHILFNPKPFPSIYENIEKEAKAEWMDLYDGMGISKSGYLHRFNSSNESIKKKFEPWLGKPELDPFKYSKGAIERLQLTLVDKINKDCAKFFDLEEREPDTTGKPIKKQYTLPTLRYPLNQMTFQEIARMGIQSYLLQELGRGTEDIQCAIRGSRQIPNRSTKSVIRQIRYRFASRTLLNNNLIENLKYEISKGPCYSNDHLLLLSDIGGYCVDNESTEYGPENEKSRSLRAEIGMADSSEVDVMQNLFDTEQELSHKIYEILKNNSYPEVYHRCCKVMQKLFSISITKSFLWEVDRSLYPDYYNVIRNPIMLCNIVTNLAHKMYGEIDYESLDSLEMDALVVLQFRNDLMQVFNNCFIFNTESSFLFTHAQKLQLAVHRHIDRWIISQNRPPLSACDERHCLINFNFISNGTNARCSRCAGEFDQESLKPKDDKNPWLFPMSASLKSEDDWICPFCLREDSKLVKYKSNNMFYIDEWGPSSFMPWILQTEVNDMLSTFSESNSFASSLLKACVIVSDPNKSFFDVPENDDRIQWTTAERIAVMEALCEAMKQNELSHNYISQLYDESNKLTKSRKPSTTFRRSDYLESLRIIFGDKGPKLLDLLLTNDDEIVRSDEEMCQICFKTTTVVDELTSDVIIICDGCSKEFHLGCSGFEDVPEEDWFCPCCSEASKIETQKSVTPDIKVKIDLYRNNQAEEALIKEAAHTRTMKSKRNKLRSATKSDIECSYCGYGELDVCSPFVIGQSIFEHDIFMKENLYCCTSNFYPDKNDTKVTFQMGGSDVDTSVKIPFFPYLDSPQGVELLDNILDLDAAPLIVHELCALQMFEARLTHNKHALRRKRNIISKKLVAMAGIPIRPLGIDSCGREYWKFPNSIHLFICTNESVDTDKIEFHNLLDLELESVNESVNREWKVVSNPNEIKSLAAALGTSRRERKLRQNLINLLLSDYTPNHYKLEFPVDNREESYKALEFLVANNSTESCYRLTENLSAAPKFDKSDRAAANDNIPFALKLVSGKGVNPVKRYCISEEAAYTDLNPGTAQDEILRFHEQFFNFIKPKSFFVISIVNKAERKLLKDKNSGYGIQYNIFREDCSFPLLSENVIDPFTDGYYYFAVPAWQRCGKYKISFYLTGPGNVQLPNVLPLVYETTVVSKEMKHGPLNALGQLIANYYCNINDRQAIHGRNNFYNDYKNRRFINDELSAVKHALLTVYYALPYGALADMNQENDDEDLKDFNVMASLSEGNTWDINFDEVWRTCVKDADNPVTLMECVILLEYYIHKSWLPLTHSRLLNALPTPIYALRSATFSAVSLRIFVLDKCLDYDKVHKKEREKRGRVLYDPSAFDYGKSASKAEDSSTAMETTRSGRRSIKTGSHSDLSTASADVVRSKRGLDEPYEGDFDRLTSKRKREEVLIKKIFSGDPSEYHDQLMQAFPFDSLIASLNEQKNEVSSGIRLLSDNIKSDNGEPYPSEIMPAEDYLSSLHAVAVSSTPSNVEVLTDSNQITEVVDAIIDNETLIKVGNEGGDTAPNYNSPSDVEMIVENTEDNDNNTNIVEATTIKFYSILREYQHDAESLLFWEAVDTKLYSDYKKIVKEPMDLGTIATRVMKGYYQTYHEQFAIDVKKVWTACKLYNEENSDLHVLATKYEEMFERLYENYFINN